MYKALIICNSTYPQDPAGLPELAGPRSDGLAIWGALTDGYTGLFLKEDVHPVFERTHADIQRETEEFFNSASYEDVLLFYFSGHGKRAAQELILCGRDTVSTALLSTGVRSDTISKMIADSNASTIIVLLDCCHSGAFKGDDIGAELSGSGRFVLAAVHASELANDADAKGRPSPFTAAIVEGLTLADIDSDSDGLIDMENLYGFVHAKLAKSGPEPKRMYDGAGDVPIAKRQKVNDQLPAAITDPFAQPVLSLDNLFPAIKKSSERGLHASEWPGSSKLVVPVGRIYEPSKGWEETLRTDLSSGAGHFIVLGGMWTGKTTALCTLACSIALTHTPHDVQLYGLHPNIGALSLLAGLPHVGAIVRYADRGDVEQLVTWLGSVLARREKRCSALGIRSPRAFRELQKREDARIDELADIILFIDSWKEFANEFRDLTDHCVKIARTGLYFGVHLALSAHQWADLDTDLAQYFNSPIELLLNDPQESRIDKELAASLPLEQRGFGLLRGGRYVQIGFPGLGAINASAADDRPLKELVAEMADAWTGDTAPAPDIGLLDEPFTRNLSLFEILDGLDPLHLELGSLWGRKPSEDQLRIRIGFGDEGQPVELDFKESAQGGMGPHGLVIGAPGSGKSELLRTVVLALALSHHPEVLNFVLVDFKGGTSFLGLDRLQHVVGVITNLEQELPLVDRMRDALQGELARRQELLRSAGNYASLRDYRRDQQGGARLEPLPTLFVVLDEFSELLSARPESIDLLVMIGRLGRSLGVHLLMASQRLEEGTLRILDSYLSYRIGLRTFSATESRMVLGTPDAYALPSQPGNGYLKTGAAGLTRFKAAYVSDWPGHDSTDQDSEAGEPLYSQVIRQLEGQGPPGRQIWLPPLDVSSTLDQLLPPLVVTPEYGCSVSDDERRGTLHALVGIVDRPFDQRREPLWADLSGSAGHIAVVGQPQSGKSTIARTLICSLALLHTPVEVQVYVLDFGGGTVSALAGLPHVGGVATRLQADRVRRTVAEVRGLLERRERAFPDMGIDSIAAFRRLRAAGEIQGDGFGDVLLVVDGWLTLRQDYEQLEDEIRALAERGLGYGIHVVAAANKWSEFRPGIQDLFGTRLELRLGDPYESEVGRALAANVPEGSPGHGLTRDGMHFLAALPRIDDRPVSDDLNDGVRELVEAVDAAWPGPRAPEVRLLPLAYPAEELPGPQETGTKIPFGIDEDTLSPVLLDFSTDPHFLILGDTECGKSNLLRLIAEGIAARHTPAQARLIFIDYRRSLLDAADTEHRIGYAASSAAAVSLISDARDALVSRLPSPDLTPEQLRGRSWWSGADLFVIVDDYDLVAGMTNPLAPLIELLPQARDIGLRVLLARSAGGAGRAMFDPALQRLREMGSPHLLMSGSKDEGQFVGGITLQSLPAGRGFFVTRQKGSIEVQTALHAMPPGASPSG